MALVAYVSREDRRVELDPAVRAGARLDGRGEAVLLHTTSLGHCQETADHIARLLRMSGWEVDVGDVENGLVEEMRSTALGMVTPEQTAALVEAITHEHVPTPTRAKPPRLGRSLPMRWVCLTCGHPTWGAGVPSHKQNRQHFDFVKVPVDEIPAVQARITHAQTPAGSPELAGNACSASEGRANGIIHPGPSAAPQGFQDGSML